MASSNQTPDVLFSPIAANADASDINTIPQTYDPANYGYAAQNVGFPTECRLPVLNPDGTLGQGRAPRMQDWNGIMKLVSSHNFFLQNGGSYTFNPTVSSNIGGYPKNAVLWYFPENEDPCLVYSLINDNTNNFVDDPTLIDGTHWEMLVNPSSYANIALTNSPYTTSRILEIPQDIDATLDSGTITSKQGTKFWFPAGTSAPTLNVGDTYAGGTITKIYWDEALLFYQVEYANDLSASSFGTSTGDFFCFSSNVGFEYGGVTLFYSGTTPPTTGYFYNTSDNTLKYYSNGSAQARIISFPVILAHRTSGVADSINQIFNGFGYIGSTLFVLPGVKVQLTWGRNIDGTLNKESNYYISKKVLTVTRTSGSALPSWSLWSDCWAGEIKNIYYIKNFKRVKSLPTSDDIYTKIFNEEDGYYYYTSSGTTPVKSSVGGFLVASNVSCDENGKVTSFTPCDVNTVNTYSRSELSGMGMPSSDFTSLTVLASGQTYTMPYNGRIYARAATNANLMAYIILQRGNNRSSRNAMISGSSVGLDCFIDVSKGDVITFHYQNVTSIYLTFEKCNGEV